MARGINKVILVGNLGQDPELRYTGSGTAVANMRLATNESYTDGDGNFVEKTEWHSVVAWARLAEICAEYLKKGSQVYFEGSLQTRSWKDRDGNTRYTTEVKLREMMMLDAQGNKAAPEGQGKRKGRGPRQQQRRRQAAPGDGAQHGAPVPAGGGGAALEDDGLPF